MKSKVVGYTRVSHRESAENGVSLEMQEEKIKTYCELHNLGEPVILSDKGISGKNLKREGIRKVLELIDQGEVSNLILYRLDRYSRRTKDILDLMDKVNNNGINLHSIEERLDTQSAMGRFVTRIMASLAEMERELIMERTQDALDSKREKGEKLGGHRPFGCDVRSGRLVPNSKEMKVIGYIKTRLKFGDSYRTIAKRLGDKGIKTASGKSKWHPYSVARVAKNGNLRHISTDR